VTSSQKENSKYQKRITKFILFEIFYQFISLKIAPRNPSHPPFTKGRRAFLIAFDQRFRFFPLWKRGMKGDLTAFQKTKVDPILKLAYWDLSVIGYL
jgi:hypothetical protein